MSSSELTTIKGDLWMLQSKDALLTFSFPALCAGFFKPTESCMCTGVRKSNAAQVASQRAHPQRKLTLNLLEVISHPISPQLEMGPHELLPPLTTGCGNWRTGNAGRFDHNP